MKKLAYVGYIQEVKRVYIDNMRKIIKPIILNAY